MHIFSDIAERPSSRRSLLDVAVNRLRGAAHRAPAQHRSALRIGACLAALALATPAVSAGAIPFPAEVELSNLLPGNGGDGSNGFVLNGIDVNEGAGRWVSTAGDVNGDGIDDLLIGAAGSPDGDHAGRSFIVFGRERSAAGFPAEFELSSLLETNGGNGSAGFVLHDGNDLSDISVGSPGDVNGDSIEDLLIGAVETGPGDSDRRWAGYVVFGRNAANAGFAAEFELAELLDENGGNGSAGFVLHGITGNDVSGVSISDAGDMNGDSIDDLVIGTAGGRSYVVFGRDGTASGVPAELDLSTLLPANGGDGSTGFVLKGIGEGTGVVSTAGDVNGDGIDDLLMGVSSASPGGRNEARESFVVFGRDRMTADFPAVLDLSSLLAVNGGDGSNGFVLNGIDINEGTGSWVNTAGDVNGDSIDDLVIGASDGQSYVVFGRDEAQFPAELDLSTLLPANGGDGSTGFVLKGIGEGTGVVSTAGDVNGDGIDDLLMGVSSASPGGRNEAGESFVVFGRDRMTADFPAVLDLSSLLTANGGNGSAGLVLNGIDSDDASGRAVSGAGDVNGDGVDDLLLGAAGADPGGRGLAGEAYVVFGRGQAADAPYPPSTVIGSVNFFWGTHRLAARGSDNHPATWSSDDKQYVAWGDGQGFDYTAQKRSLGVSSISGAAASFDAVDVYYGSPNSKRPRPIQDSQVNGLIDGKSYGLISIGGILYMWVNPGSGKDAYISQRLYFSTNRGLTWSRANWDFPPGDKIVNLTFAQFGKDYAGAKDSYVYMYAVRVKDSSKNRMHKPGEIVLLRAPKAQLTVKSAYRYFAGFSGTTPIWSTSVSALKPVFADANGVGSTVSVAYLAGLQRYVLATEHHASHDGRIGMHEAPQPWGPWKTILYTKQAGVARSAFFWNLSSKWAGTFGQNFVLIFSGEDSYNSVGGTFVPVASAQGQ